MDAHTLSYVRSKLTRKGKTWCTEKYLQKLEAMLIVSDGKDLFVIPGAGDVLTPKNDIAAMESSDNYALAGGRAMMTNCNMTVE